MNIKTKKHILNIFLGLIPSSKLRKNIRNKLLYNNRFIIIDKNIPITNRTKKGIDINFIGRNSTVIIHEPMCLHGCSITIGNNSKVEIFSSAFCISNLHITASNNSEVTIGEDFSCNGCTIENHDESNLKVLIGKDCMFSYGIHIRVSDGHSIYQLNNSKIINKPQRGITIGDHVWVGMNCTILKDVSISSDTIIGAHSLINKSVREKNVILAGIPAKIIRENVNWSRNNTDSFEI